MTDRSVACGLAGPGFDVAAHVLAHVPVSASAPPVVRAASLHDPAYVAWCRAALGDGVLAPIERDRELLAELLSRASSGHLLQALLGLLDDAEAHHATAMLELDALEGRASAWALAPLAVLDGEAPELVSLARCVVGLVARGYGRAWRAHLAHELEAAVVGVGTHLTSLARTVPSLRSVRVALSHPLGARGRVLPGLLVVGAPVPWAGIDAARAAAIALHEHAVGLASADDPSGAASPSASSAEARWASAEALALAAVPRLALPAPVAEAHHEHVGTLDRRGLRPAEPRAVEALVARLVL